MKRLAVLLLLVAGLASAAEDWEAICQREGGCKMITTKAYNVLIDEIIKLNALVKAIRKEQCT
jgi:hypothetical protein